MKKMILIYKDSATTTKEIEVKDAKHFKELTENFAEHEMMDIRMMEFMPIIMAHDSVYDSIIKRDATWTVYKDDVPQVMLTIK